MSEWTPQFVGQRPPFAPGNTLAERHGCRSKMRLQPRADEYREELVDLVPFGSEADGPLLDLLSFTLSQVERAGLVLTVEQAATEATGAPSERLDRLASDARSWVRTASRLLDQLGLSPTSRARLAGDLAGAQRALTVQSLREQYGDGEAAA